MSIESVGISSAAYSIIVLHCAKHPASEVMGFLLGTVTSSGVHVEKAIAVQHHWNRLSPMVEVAASLVQAHAASSSPSLQLVGLYHADSNVTSSEKSELNLAAAKVAKSLASTRGSTAIVLQVNNALLSSTTQHALIGYAISTNASNSSEVAVQLDNTDTVSKTRKATADGAWKRIHDFDDHLEDTSLNWLEAVV